MIPDALLSDQAAPLGMPVLALQQGARCRVMLGNTTRQPQTVAIRLPAPAGPVRLRMLDAATEHMATHTPERFRQAARNVARRDGREAVYTDATAMLRGTAPDFVDIVTQPAAHRPLVELAAGHEVPVICQKPMAPTLEDARAMVAACAAAGVPFMVHENFRWQTPLRALKEAAATLGPHYALTVVRDGSVTHRQVPPRRFAWQEPPGAVCRTKPPATSCWATSASNSLSSSKRSTGRSPTVPRRC